MEVQLLALLLLFFDSQKKKERHPSFLPFPLFDFAQQLPCDLSALPCLSLFNLRRRKGGGGAGHIPAARVEEKRKIPVPAFACFFCVGTRNWQLRWRQQPTTDGARSVFICFGPVMVGGGPWSPRLFSSGHRRQCNEVAMVSSSSSSPAPSLICWE